MRARPHLACAAATWIIAGVAGAAHAEPLRVSYAAWPGFGPFFVAEKKGLFANEGVDVELIEIEENTAAFAVLANGQLHAFLGTIPDSGGYYRVSETPIACALALDTSFGGDGVLASKDIRSISDLKGRSVAFLHGGLGQFYLSVLLREAGLSEADIEAVDLVAEDATNAFLLQDVDAAVVYEPWLSQGKAANHGHVLTDTSEQPGLIFDCLLTTADLFRRRNADFRAVARAWFAALDYIEAHPEEAMEIMARNVGAGLDGAAFAEALKGLRFYDREGNEAYFGTPEKPGPIYEAVQHAIDVFSDLGMLTFDMKPSYMIIHGILDE